MTFRPAWPGARRRRVRRPVLISVTALGVMLPGTSSALATPGDGYLRLAHLSPDTPAVDVYLYAAGRRTPRLVLKHVGYGALSPYQRLGGGAYTVAMRPADAAATSPPVLSAHVRVRARAAYTVAGLGPYKGLTLQVLEDTRTAPAGRVALRVIQASLRRPVVTVTVGRRALARDLRFPDVTSYRPVRAGVTTVRVTGGSGAPVTSRPTLRAGSVHTLVLLDEASGPRLLDLRDAAAPRRTPRGPVETGLGGLAGRAAPPPRTVPPFLPSTPFARLFPVPDAPAEAGDADRAGGHADPAALRIPAIGVRTPLDRLATDARGRLLPPRDPARAGWFGEGIRPGDTGPAVIAGHLDSRTGPGVFARLATLRPGDRVLVTDATGRVAAFTVDRVRSFPKSAFPTEDVYGATHDPQLRLITCGGAFDPVSGHYRRDVVVYATLGHEPG